MKPKGIPPRGSIPRLSIFTIRRAIPSTTAPAINPLPAPDDAARRQREAFRRALAAKRQQLETILEDLVQSTDKWLQQEAALIQEQLNVMDRKERDNTKGDNW